MKTIKTIIFFVIFSSYLFPQVEEEETAWFVELILGFSNCPQPNSYTFYLDKVSTIWAANNIFNPPGFFINEDSEIDNSIYPWHVQNTAPSNPGDWKGWNMVYSQDQTTINDTVVPVYGYGLYKISTNASNSHFYIDYRDDRIPYFNVTHIGHAVDHWVKYDFSNNKFYISPISHLSSYTEISNGDLIRFWELKETNPTLPSTSEFPNYWENCLALIPSVNNSPRLIWGPYPVEGESFEVNSYNIYRAISSFPDPNTANFSYLTSVSASEFEYTDLQYSIGYGWYGFYKITAVDDEIESDFSNIASTGIDAFSKENAHGINKNINSDYLLSQNYPNPFNPSTMISYSIPENSYVTLKMYDILGNVIADLVNERKEAGNYSVIFNASDLSSGLYIYTLRVNGYSFTKKMILTK